MQLNDLQTFTQEFYSQDKQKALRQSVPQLFFLNGPQAGTAVPCDTDSTTVGRSLQNKICLNSPKISKNHCEIINENNQFYLIDHHSKNGTVLNNKILKGNKKIILSHGDMIQLCETSILFLNPDKSSTSKNMKPIK